MFNSTRWSRLLTVPALLVATAILFLGPNPFWTIVFFPPAAALPWLVVAAAKVTPRAIRHGLIATRAAACVTTAAWGLLALRYSLVGAAIIVGASLLLLQAAGTKTSEPRLAIVVLILGALIALVAVPMMWLGVRSGILLPTGLVMCAGGASWLAESARAPVSDEVIPFAIAAEALPRDTTVIAA
jgi:hypothetical protein